MFGICMFLFAIILSIASRCQAHLFRQYTAHPCTPPPYCVSCKPHVRKFTVIISNKAHAYNLCCYSGHTCPQMAYLLVTTSVGSLSQLHGCVAFGMHVPILVCQILWYLWHSLCARAYPHSQHCVSQSAIVRLSYQAPSYNMPSMHKQQHLRMHFIHAFHYCWGAQRILYFWYVFA